MNLKRVFILFILTVFVCTAGTFPSRAQNGVPNGPYRNPSEVSIDRLVRKTFRDYFPRGGYEQLGAESFFPIGWSKDGKFAFYTEPVDEACHCYFAELYILDLKNDKILWSINYNSDFLDEAKKEKRPYSLETLWQSKRELFSENLNKHQIEPQGRLAVLSFPLTYNGDRLSTNMSIVENPDEESRPYGVVRKATLQLRSKRSGKKTLSEKSYAEAMPLDVRVLGYIKSPFEERIAVVLLEVFRGYEGPPHTGHIKIVGASLNTGFK